MEHISSRRRFAAVVLLCMVLVGCTSTGGSGAGMGQATAGATVPVLVGLSESDAAQALTTANLKLGMVTSAFDASAPVGVVTTQAPAAGLAAPAGSSVAVVVSKGPDSVTVVDVKGDSEAKARSSLAAVGLVVKITTKDDKSKKGTVLKQSPAAGSTLVRGATVKLTVSTGMVRVPSWEDFRGSYNGSDWNKVLESAEAAVKAGFRRAGLVAVVEFINGYGGAKAYQSIKAGSRAKAGTRVHIHIPVYD